MTPSKGNKDEHDSTGKHDKYAKDAEFRVPYRMPELVGHVAWPPRGPHN